eukprot:jgi/Botrbrau1/15082/Bobra.0221s0001.1
MCLNPPNVMHPAPPGNLVRFLASGTCGDQMHALASGTCGDQVHALASGPKGTRFNFLPQVSLETRCILLSEAPRRLQASFRFSLPGCDQAAHSERFADCDMKACTWQVKWDASQCKSQWEGTTQYCYINVTFTRHVPALCHSASSPWRLHLPACTCLSIRL